MASDQTTVRTSCARSAVDPARWWRTPCRVTPRVWLCGDLDSRSHAAGVAQLRQWVEIGVTDIVDVRGEHSDASFVRREAPHIVYHHAGTHDDGGAQPDEWFAGCVNAGLQALADEAGTVLYHCHMGVNRAPSAVYALMLALGYDPIDALVTIREARPIAAILYAPDALDWWHRTSGTAGRDAGAEMSAVRQWMHDHSVAHDWIVSRLHQAGRSS